MQSISNYKSYSDYNEYSELYSSLKPMMSEENFMITVDVVNYRRYIKEDRDDDRREDHHDGDGARKNVPFDSMSDTPWDKIDSYGR